VQLSAVDLQVVPLTQGFVAANGAEMQTAVTSLRDRAPLGSTDFDVALESAAGALSSSGGDRAKAIVYIGDGMSTAQIIGTSRMQQLVDRLVESRAPFNAFAIGPRVDVMLLGALAADTGGVLAVDRPESVDAKTGRSVDAGIPARQFGMFLAEAATAPVAWPSDVQIDPALGEIYPKKLPPLRFDRETIFVGNSQQAPSGTVGATFDVAGVATPMQWTVTGKPGDPDNAYLDEVVTLAARDGGVSLPLVGTAGLHELRTMVNVQAQSMARLGQQAVATGNAEQAKRYGLTPRILKRSP
jgi:hypothetical protein